jgi:hypothetical protein
MFYYSDVQYVPVIYTGRFIMFSVITNIYDKKTKGPKEKFSFPVVVKNSIKVGLLVFLL